MYSDIVHFYDEFVNVYYTVSDVTINYDDMQEFLSELEELKKKYWGVSI